MLSILNFIKFWFNDNPTEWVLWVGLVVAILIISFTLYIRIRYGHVKASDLMSEEEYDTQYPYGENFVTYLAIPILSAAVIMLLCMGVHNLIKAEVVTVNEEGVEDIVYPLFGKGAPSGVVCGKYVVNEGDKEFVLWQVILKNKYKPHIKILKRIPSHSVVKIPVVPKMYADSADFGNEVEVKTVLLSSKGFIDSLSLDYQVGKVWRYSKDEPRHLEYCDMAVLRKRFAL